MCTFSIMLKRIIQYVLYLLSSMISNPPSLDESSSQDSDQNSENFPESTSVEIIDWKRHQYSNTRSTSEDPVVGSVIDPSKKSLINNFHFYYLSMGIKDPKWSKSKYRIPEMDFSIQELDPDDLLTLELSYLRHEALMAQNNHNPAYNFCRREFLDEKNRDLYLKHGHSKSESCLRNKYENSCCAICSLSVRIGDHLKVFRSAKGKTTKGLGYGHAACVNFVIKNK